MNPHRFDSFAKQFSTRLSRRDALRAGAALGAVTLFRGSTAFAQRADVTVKDRFISIRTYPYTGNIADAATGLKGLVPLMEQQPGFISIDFVDGNDEIHVVATFLDKSSAIAAAKAEDTWISENAAEILAGKPSINSGPTFLRSELHTGCGCTTGTADPCGSDRLVCCGTTNLDGGPGVCLTEATTCPAVDGPTPTATSIPAQPTEVPVEVPTDVPTCTGDGCSCIGGVEGGCDDGLVCCADTPGGYGTCLTDAECNPTCTGDGCACIGGAEGGCDSGLVCCADTPGGSGSCVAESVCYPTCTAEGCACDAGTSGACDDGLCCVGSAAPGGQGTCSTDCGTGSCTSEGCACDASDLGSCDDGLACCGTCEMSC